MSSVGWQTDPQVQSRPAGHSHSSALRACAYAFLLVILSLALYYPVRSHGYVDYDDNLYVTDNDHVKNGLTWDTVSWAFTAYEAGNWHPLTWLSHALDFELYGMNPAGHHETNLLLHALNAVLVFWVLLRATGCAGRSFMVAALFAVHPINVEPVVWIAERKTLLSMTFFLLALGAYGWYASAPVSAKAPLAWSRRAGRYLLVAVLFALGLLAKPQIITFPFVLLLWDFWPLQRMSFAAAGRGDAAGARYSQRNWPALVAEKLPLFAIVAADAAMTMRAQREAGAVLSLGAIPLSLRLSNAIVSYVKYVAKAFWPAKLAPMYPHPANLLRAWQVYLALLILLAITMFVFEKRRRRYLLVGWLWFLGTLVPMIGLVQVGRQAMADRYAYLPLLGIFIMVCWSAADWLEAKRAPAALLPIASAVIIVALALVARRQIGYWADNELLWRHTIAVTLPNYVAEDNLGGTLLMRKRSEEAIVHFRRAAAIHPTDPISTFNIGLYEQEHGDLQQAIEHYQRAMILTTSASLKVLALNNMARAYSDLGEPDQARECFDEALKLQAP